MQSSALVITASFAFWYRPDGHGKPAEAPSVQYSPPGQAWQAVLPGSPWYVPEPHLVQLAWPVAFCTVPGLHGEWSVAPVEHDEPVGHAVHWPLLSRPGVLE